MLAQIPHDDDVKLENKKKSKQNKNERGKRNGTEEKKYSAIVCFPTEYYTRSDVIYFHSIVWRTYLRKYYISLNLVL